MLRWIAFCLLLLLPAVAGAQCVGGAPAGQPNSGVPFNCVTLPTPTLSDLVLGGSQSQSSLGGGKGTGSFSMSQIVGLDHSASPVTATGGSAPVTLADRAAQAVSPMDFGAICNDVADDAAALNAWWAYIIRTGAVGNLPAATCKANSPLVWSMATRRGGIRIQGSNQGTSVIDLKSVSSGIPLLITGGNLFYGHFSDFTIQTNIAGPGVELGNSSLTDALNGFTFRQLEFKNFAINSAAIALQVNGCFNCDFATVTTNTGGASTNNTGLGVSLELNYAAFCRFQGSFSSAATGLHLTRFFVFANVFEALDIENVNVGIVIDSVNAARNTITGAQIGAFTGLDFTAGGQNVVANPNISPYMGGTATAGTVGMWLQQLDVGVSTPAMPASNATITNSTGRLLSIIIYGGTVTQVVVGGGVYTPISAGSFVMRPGDTIAITYSVAPAWDWIPIL